MKRTERLRKPRGVTTLLILLVLMSSSFLPTRSAKATAVVTPATGGGSLSADTTGGSYTSLTGPVISEGATADIGVGTITLDVPSGFVFDTGGTAPTVLVTRTSGTGANNRNINNVASGTSVAITSRTTSQITFTVTDVTSSSVRNSLTWQNVRVRPSAGTPLASGNITKSGISSIVGVTGSTNFGTLTEVAGAKTQLVITTQPSSSATSAIDFGTKPVVAVRDQFGNTLTSDSSTTISQSAVLSTQSCGGTAGSGTLSSTPSNGAAVSSGVLTYTSMQYSVAESIKICFSSSGITSALSNAVTVNSPNNPVPATSGISPTSKTAGDPGFTLTVNGSNFVSSSVVRFNGSDRTTVFVNSGQVTATIPSSDLLVAGTFSITVFNPTPGGGTSNAQTFSVNAAPPPTDATAPSVVANLALSGATDSSINLTWTAPGDDGGSGTATSYDIRYSTSDITDGNFGSATQVSGEPTPSIAGTSQGMTVSGLSANTTYFFAMKTSDEVPNVSAISNVPSLSTLSSPPGPDTTAPSAITDLALSGPSESSLTLTWTAPGDDGSSGTAASYDVRYSTAEITAGNFDSASQATGEPSPGVAGSSQNMILSGLSANTTYFVAMKTSDEVPNVSAISNVPSLSTADVGTPAPPPPPPAGAPPQPLDTSVNLSGQAYPGSTIDVLKRSITEARYYISPTVTLFINPDGTFEAGETGMVGDEYIYTLQIQDLDGRKTSIFFNVDLISQSHYSMQNILVPPTVEIRNRLLSRTEDLQMIGYAVPNYTIQADVDGVLQNETVRSNQNGFYTMTVRSGPLAIGTHYVKIRQIDEDGRKSDFSATLAFKKSLLLASLADFNDDGKINITDWSIFLFRWNSQDQDLRAAIDLDGNGTIDIFDLSIFLKSFEI